MTQYKNKIKITPEATVHMSAVLMKRGDYIDRKDIQCYGND